MTDCFPKKYFAEAVASLRKDVGNTAEAFRPSWAISLVPRFQHPLKVLPFVGLVMGLVGIILPAKVVVVSRTNMP